MFLPKRFDNKKIPCLGDTTATISCEPAISTPMFRAAALLCFSSVYDALSPRLTPQEVRFVPEEESWDVAGDFVAKGGKIIINSAAFESAR